MFWYESKIKLKGGASVINTNTRRRFLFVTSAEGPSRCPQPTMMLDADSVRKIPIIPIQIMILLIM
jgi:hypothetical protein